MTAVTTSPATRYSCMSRESELELVSRLRAGDRAAFDCVYEMFNTRLFTFLVRLTRSRDRAEDLLEETWLRLVTHADRLRPDTTLGPWLFTVARNLYVSYCRSHMLEELYAEEGPGLWPISATPSPFEETAANELDRRMETPSQRCPSSIGRSFFWWQWKGSNNLKRQKSAESAPQLCGSA